MNYKLLSTMFLGFFIMGISTGYVLGFYLGKYIDNINLFYLSTLFLAIGILVLIYGSLFKMENGN